MLFHEIWSSIFGEASVGNTTHYNTKKSTERRYRPVYIRRTSPTATGRFQLDLKLPVDNYMSPQSVIKNVTSAILCTL